MTKGRIAFLIFAAVTLLIGALYVHGEHWPWRPQGLNADLERGYYRAAVDRLLELEPEGDHRVLTTLANLYLLGLGVGKNPVKAATLYSRAAFSGDVHAQVNMGHVYKSGIGVAEDSEIAYAWFNLARNNGSKVGQEYMSAMLADHKLSAQIVNDLRMQYATINNFPKLH